MPRASILPTAKSIQPAPQAHSLLDLLSSETYYDVFQAIVQNLPTSAIIALTRVCRHLSGLYRYLLPRDWNIDRHLSRFFQDPLGLRSQMAKSNALISGMMAFRFFEGFLGHPYLEVFVRRGRDAERFTKYLQDIEGYKDPARMSETDTLSLDIAYVQLSLLKPSTYSL